MVTAVHVTAFAQAEWHLWNQPNDSVVVNGQPEKHSKKKGRVQIMNHWGGMEKEPGEKKSYAIPRALSQELIGLFAFR